MPEVTNNSCAPNVWQARGEAMEEWGRDIINDTLPYYLGAGAAFSGGLAGMVFSAGTSTPVAAPVAAIGTVGLAVTAPPLAAGNASALTGTAMSAYGDHLYNRGICGDE